MCFEETEMAENVWHFGTTRLTLYMLWAKEERDLRSFLPSQEFLSKSQLEDTSGFSSFNQSQDFDNFGQTSPWKE